MADDKDPGHAAERRSAQFAVQPQQDRPEPELPSATPRDPATGDSPKVRQTLFKGWRPLAFLLIAAIAFLTGLHFKSLSNPGSENRKFATQPPQIIDFFVSNPNISVQVITLVDQSPGASTADVTYGARIEMPASDRIGSILVLSNGPAEDGYNYYHLSSPPLNRVERDGFPYFDGYYASQSTVPNPRDLQVSRELVLGDFQTPAVIEQTNAAIYGHLPLIGDLDVADGDSPAVLAEEQAHANELRDVVYGPVTDSSSQLPSSYSTPYGGRAELFWIPRNFSISETLETVTPFFLQNEQPDYITPPGKFSEGNYVWEANTDLEATFESTNQDAAQAESNNAFLSGIIFGVAGAAAIALVQEIPETFSMPAWWPLGKRRHKSLRFSQQA